jgi:hypothetical protein
MLKAGGRGLRDETLRRHTVMAQCRSKTNLAAPTLLEAETMTDKEETEKSRAHWRALFEGIVGRKPKTDQELDEWLASPDGKTATIFEPTSATRWGKVGRS